MRRKMEIMQKCGENWKVRGKLEKNENFAENEKKLKSSRKMKKNLRKFAKNEKKLKNVAKNFRNLGQEANS